MPWKVLIWHLQAMVGVILRCFCLSLIKTRGFKLRLRNAHYIVNLLNDQVEQVLKSVGLVREL